MTKSRYGALLRTPALAALVLFAGCNGDNLFEGSRPAVSQVPPAITSISAPESIAAGARLDVRIRGIAPRGMTRIDVRYRRAINTERSFTFESRTDSVTLDTSIDVPLSPSDSVLVIEAFATDAGGRVSDIVSTTVRIIAAPAPTAAASRHVATSGTNAVVAVATVANRIVVDARRRGTRG